MSSRCLCSEGCPYSDLNAQVKGHHWPPLLTSSPPDDWVSQKMSSCEAVGPGQPLWAVVTEWEHAVLSLLAPLSGAPSMCYNNKPQNPDHTLPYLKIFNENIWSKCTQSGNRAQSHTLTELPIETLKTQILLLSESRLHTFWKKNNSQKMGKTDHVYETSLQSMPHLSLGFPSAKKPAILSSMLIGKLTQPLSAWLFGFRVIVLESSNP